MTSLAWHKVCKSKEEDGFVLRSIKNINKKAIGLFFLELAIWGIGVTFLIILTPPYGLPPKLTYTLLINDNSQWLVGNGDKVHFWTDCWHVEPLVQFFNIDPTIKLEAKVKYLFMIRLGEFLQTFLMLSHIWLLCFKKYIFLNLIVMTNWFGLRLNQAYSPLRMLTSTSLLLVNKSLGLKLYGINIFLLSCSLEVPLECLSYWWCSDV
jgi:hypothetical protein